MEVARLGGRPGLAVQVALNDAPEQLFDLYDSRVMRAAGG